VQNNTRKRYTCYYLPLTNLEKLYEQTRPKIQLRYSYDRKRGAIHLPEEIIADLKFLLLSDNKLAAVKTLALDGLCSRFPQASQAELRYCLAVLLLGEELARKVYGDLPHAE
jgi:hypothetical protein